MQNVSPLKIQTNPPRSMRWRACSEHSTDSFQERRYGTFKSGSKKNFGPAIQLLPSRQQWLETSSRTLFLFFSPVRPLPSVSVHENAFIFILACFDTIFGLVQRTREAREAKLCLAWVSGRGNLPVSLACPFSVLHTLIPPFHSFLFMPGLI